MKYYAVSDTNVLVSAFLKWESIPGKIMEMVFSGMILPVLSTEIMNEYREVLSRPKFHLTEDIVRNITDTIDSCAIYLDAKKIEIELPDPKDRVFYEVVMESRRGEDTYLVTGNMKHFPQKTFIVTPREMLEIILDQMDAADDPE